MSEWKPIDTAPRDGTWIIGIENGDDEDMYKCKCIDSHWFDYTETELFCLSHWIPLPLIPKKKCKCGMCEITETGLLSFDIFMPWKEIPYRYYNRFCPACGDKA